MITYYDDLIQGSEEWHEARRGILTASEMRLIISAPPPEETRIKKNGEPYKQREWKPIADNDACRAHLYELLGQRITGYVEPHYMSDDMARGHQDEIEARDLYSKMIAKVKPCGFITNDKWGFKVGYSPDGLVGDDGLIECKSRRQKFQVETIITHHLTGDIPADFIIQCQTGLAVAEREWVDLVSYSGGLPMRVMRVYPMPEIQKTIIEAAEAFEKRLAERLEVYVEAINSSIGGNFPTERKIEMEMFA